MPFISDEDRLAAAQNAAMMRSEVRALADRIEADMLDAIERAARKRYAEASLIDTFKATFSGGITDLTRSEFHFVDARLGHGFLNKVARKLEVPTRSIRVKQELGKWTEERSANRPMFSQLFRGVDWVSLEAFTIITITPPIQ